MSNDVFDESYIKYVPSSDLVAEMKKQFESIQSSEQNHLFEKLIGSIDERTASQWTQEVRESRDEWDEQVNWENKID